MDKLTTLGEVAERVDSMSLECVDANIPVSDISFENIETVCIGNEKHIMKPIAQRSIAYRLGIPYQYLSKCPEDIQAINMNHWIQHERNDELFFRYNGNEVRALFTPKYIPVDNFEVLEKLDSMGFGPETKVQCNLDEEFMSLSIMNGNHGFEINGEQFKNGLSISNSEVGLALLSIAAFILRLVCTNGLVRRSELGSKSYRHVSARILDELPDTIEAVLNENDNQKDQIRLSLESPVDEPLKTIESFNRQFILKQNEKDAVEWAWPMEMGSTMFHIVNTYTKSAQFDGLAAESSFRLMKTGGTILGMLN